MLKSNREFQKLMLGTESKMNYLTAICTACKCQTLLPLGIKVGCDTCGYVGDHPEDG